MNPPADAAGRGERKLVTILFADLSGFTALSETLDPEEVRELVNDCFDVLVPVIERCGGTVDKFIGDEIMALFGAPVAHEDDPTRCLTAALAMMDEFGLWGAERDFVLGLHVGVESGTVVTGGLGSRGREEYTVVGDAVNLAARLADASEAGEILVGPAARRLAGPGFAFAELTPMVLKGKAEPVPVSRLECSDEPAARQRRPQVMSPLVGRDRELAELVEAVAALSAGRGAAIAVVGEPGLGKSRLLAEVRAASPVGVRWAEARGQAFGQTASYTVAVRLLEELTAPGEEEAEAGAALRAAVASAFPEPGAFGDVFPYLARLCSGPLKRAEEERVLYLPPEVLRARIRAAFAAFVRALSISTPLVVVWEDLHWADASSLDVAEALLPLTAESPLLLVLVYRPHEGEVDEWAERAARLAPGGLRVMCLQPLDEADSASLIAGLVPVQDLPAQARRLILDKADGNPFFLEELLRSLLDAKLIQICDGRVVVAERIADLTVPDTVQGVAAARIDALASADKSTLQCASVIGRAFDVPVLSGVYARTERDWSDRVVVAALAELCRRELVRGRGREGYLFKHAVTREVAYTSLLLSRRRELHQDVAEILEAMFPERRDELAATLGQHWRAAGVHERALAFLLVAAGRARETFSNAEARRLYEEALVEAGDDAPARSGIHESLGDLLLLAGEPAAARVHFEAALADGCGDDLLAARLQRKVGDSWVPTSSADEASAAYERAATALGPKPAGAAREWWHEWTTLLVARMWLCYWVADEAGMDGFIEEARGALQTLGDRVERLPLLFTLPLFDLRRSRYHPSEQALEWTNDYLAAAEEAGDIGELARATAIHAFTRMWRGELEAARPMYERNLELCRRLGDVTGEIRALVYLGVMHRIWGDVQAVRALAEQALALARAAGLPEYTGSALGHLAWVSCREGDARKARGDGEAAWQDLRQAPADPFVWLAAWPLLAVRLRDGDVAGGVELARRLIDPAQMKLPDELEGPLRRAAEAWDDGDEHAAGEALSLAVERAEASSRGWL